MSIFQLQWVHVASTLMKFYADKGLSLIPYGWSVLLCMFLPVSQAVTIPFCTKLDLQLSLYRPLWYNSRTLWPLLQYLRTISAILAGAHYYFVVSSYMRGKIVAITLSPTFVYNTVFHKACVNLLRVAMAYLVHCTHDAHVNAGRITVSAHACRSE